MYHLPGTTVGSAVDSVVTLQIKTLPSRNLEPREGWKERLHSEQ